MTVTIPPPLAVDATTATTSTARCHYCQRTILHGERYASLVPNGTTAHLHYIGRAFGARRRAVPVIR